MDGCVFSQLTASYFILIFPPLPPFLPYICTNKKQAALVICDLFLVADFLLLVLPVGDNETVVAIFILFLKQTS